MDEIEVLLNKKFMRFIMQRAENFLVIRRKPVEVLIFTDFYRDMTFHF